MERSPGSAGAGASAGVSVNDGGAVSTGAGAATAAAFSSTGSSCRSSARFDRLRFLVMMEVGVLFMDSSASFVPLARRIPAGAAAGAFDGSRWCCAKEDGFTVREMAAGVIPMTALYHSSFQSTQQMRFYWEKSPDSWPGN